MKCSANVRQNRPERFAGGDFHFAPLRSMVSARTVSGMPRQHCLHHGLQGVSVGRDDLPEDGIVDAKVLVTDTVADAPDLASWLSREFRKPIVGNAPHGLRYGLDCIGSRTTNYRITPKGVQCRAGLDIVQDRDLRIPMMATTDSGGWRPPVPIEDDQRSRGLERRWVDRADVRVHGGRQGRAW
jgi:hypothetical protein